MAKDFTSGLAGTDFEIAINAMKNAAANTNGDKKALVVFYLGGGMDCHNFVSPANTASSNRSNYNSARPLTGVPVDRTQQTILPVPVSGAGKDEWQLHPRFFGMQHASSTIQPNIVVSGTGTFNDGEIAVIGDYERDSAGLVRARLANHGLSTGDKVYADFSPFSNTTPTLPTDPTDGLYTITVEDTTYFNFTPQPVITNSVISLTSFRFVKEKYTAKKAFTDGDAAVMMNVGTLIYPAYRSEWETSYPYNYLAYPAKRLPNQLSSHSDQSLEWFTGLPQNPTSPSGWMGRTMDLINPAYNANTNLPTMFTLSGLNSGLYGKVPNRVSTGPSGLPSKGVIDGNSNLNINTIDRLLINNIDVANPMMREYLDGQIRANTNLVSIHIDIKYAKEFYASL